MTKFQSIMIWIGGVALLAATFVDTIAVGGRYIGLPLRGSIELMQAMVLVAGAVGMTIATLAANHARIRLVIDNFGPRLRSIMDRLSELSTALFFIALLAGSGWIAFDLWNEHEVSEVLGVPWWLMRLFANLCLMCCVGIALQRAIAGKSK